MELPLKLFLSLRKILMLMILIEKMKMVNTSMVDMNL